MTHILIQGGRIIDPKQNVDHTGDILIVDDKIAQITTQPGQLSPNRDTLSFNAEGCIVTPGLIDPHVHCRQPSGGKHEETISHALSAAVRGGFTSVCAMPNTSPPLDSPDRIRQQYNWAQETASARLFSSACGTLGRKGDEPAPIAALTDAGAVAITDDGDCIASAEVLHSVLQQARDSGRCFMQHCQDPLLTEGASMNEGPVAGSMGQIGWPRTAEEIIVQHDLTLNQDVGCHYHIQHISSGGTVNFLRQARARQQPATGEVSPHHLLLTDEACLKLGTQAKMNPPLRAKADIDQLKESVAEGVITILATDHAPHPASTKDVPFADAAFGIVGLECALALYIRALITDGVLNWTEMLAMMTHHPASLLGIDKLGLGYLQENGPADVTIIDPNLAWTIDPAQFASTGRNCPFAGWDVTGQAIATIVAGQLKDLKEPERIAPDD